MVALVERIPMPVTRHIEGGSRMASSTVPNVVFIVGDNVGWGDIGCYGGLAPTPRIDALAAQGMRFKNYNVEAQCTPTRSAILTGRLPIRTGNCSVPLPGQGDYGLAPWEYTLGELFSDAGYATGAFGKWHVGDIEGRLPTDQGFDEWFGIKNTSDEAAYSAHPLFAESGAEVPKIWEGVAGSPVTPVDEFNLRTRPLLDEQIATRAAAFIAEKAAAGTPFFAYVCFTQMHPPLIRHPDFRGRSGGGVYSDTLAELDHRTGQVLDAIDEAGITDNTIVVWTSDNPAGRAQSMGGSNGPWRGHFGSGFEGGMRAPGMVRWPGHVPAGAVTDEIVTAVDWLPTLASLVGESKRVPDRPPDRRRRCLLVPARAEPDIRTGPRHLLRVRRRADVGQVAHDEGRVPLQREHQRSDHQAAVAVRVRPDRRPQRGVGPDREAPRQRLGRRARRPTSRRTAAVA